LQGLIAGIQLGMQLLAAFLLAAPLFGETPALERFVPMDTASEPALESLIEQQIQNALGPPQTHPAALFTIKGQYRRDASGLSLYAQIYSARGELIDAYAIETSQEQGVLMDPEEMRGYEASQVRSFAQKVALRLKSNPRSVVRHENIDEYLRSTRAGRVVSAPARNEDRRGGDVFQIFQERVTVASNVVAEAEKQPASVTVISSIQIRQSGARTLSELLTLYVPGYFAVQDQDDIIAGFRGLAPDNNSKVLLLLNGTNMNTEWFFGPPDSIINGLNLEFIERVEVIRGPGSVTLGQGALLGVINIVTRSYALGGTLVHASGGQDGFGSASIQTGGTGQLMPELRAYASFQKTNYSGQALRNEGWAHDRIYEGAEGWYDARVKARTASELEIYKNVAHSGSRLGRAAGETAFASLGTKGFEVEAYHSDQLRDQFNFYRDRNELRNVITSGQTQYEHFFTDRVSLMGRGFYTMDDVILQSHGGQTMGGTREIRYGGSAMLRWNTAQNRNRLAVGGEYRRYDMGLPDRNGNNFIVNKADSTLLDDVNRKHRYVFPDSIIVYSGFAEDFFSVTSKLDLFAAFRYDKHIFWGSNISPRIGALYSVTQKTRLRVSYQEGFRGAAGLSFTGGFQGDGLLRSSNFDKVAFAQIPTADQFNQPAFFENVTESKPEKMRSYELAFSHSPGANWTVEGVGFYNIIRDVIDVGVIYADPAVFPMPRIGTDEPGDWNGYFFFRNLPGVIRSGGFEGGLKYQSASLTLNLTHSIARVLSASDSLYFKPYGGGMYLSEKRDNKHFRAYPENVTRFSAALGVHSWILSATYLYYANWYSPAGNRIEGDHIMNAGIGYRFAKDGEFSVVVRNVFASGALYPMNSNAGDSALSDGSPAIEGRSYLAVFRLLF
jgi:outer membrane receptor protein involved in Fe transport